VLKKERSLLMNHSGIDKPPWGELTALVGNMAYPLAVKGGCGDGLFR